MNVSNQTEQNDYWVDMNISLDRLNNGTEMPGDFKKVIVDGYFHDYAINQTSLLASPLIIKQGQRSAVMEKLIAISSLQDYLLMIRDLGMAEKEEELSVEDMNEIEALDEQIEKESVA